MAKKVAFKSIASSVTGFSTPIFGISWNPPKDQRKLVRELVTFLEDRRALTYSHMREDFHHVTESILRIRDEVTKTLQQSPENPVLTDPLRAMRAACRRYLDKVDPNKPQLVDHFGGTLGFAASLGELRGVFGLHLSRLCVAFGVNVEPELASIFPAADSDVTSSD